MKLLVRILFAASLAIPHLALGNQCRCLSSDPCWPSSSDFASLASQVSQPLLHPVPPESACYPVSHPSGDCATVQQSTTDGIWRAAQPGAMQSPNFETFTFPNGTISACYLNTTIGAPCQQGSISVIGVDARTVSDVQAAVKFASKHNLRLVVKGTGCVPRLLLLMSHHLSCFLASHDNMGRSTARGSFMIWTHNFQDLVYNPAFVPHGAPPTETYQGNTLPSCFSELRYLHLSLAMTVGAGVQWRTVFDAINAQGGRVIVGGGCDTVGAAGGWVLGGGHSSLSTAYGLGTCRLRGILHVTRTHVLLSYPGVDNAIEFSVVTANGNFIIANSHLHTDLFWALRGGGGGTYGIVISVTYNTHPPTSVVTSTIVATSTNPDTRKKLITEFVRISPTLSDAGWAGYIYLLDPTAFSLLTIAPNVTWAQANASWDPFFAYANSLASEGLQVSTAFTLPLDSWHTWYKQILPPFTTGTNDELGSRLLPKDFVINNYQEIGNTLAGVTGAILSVLLPFSFTQQ